MGEKNRELEAQQISDAMRVLDGTLAKLYGPDVVASVTIVVMGQGAWVMSRLDEFSTVRALELALDQMRDCEKQTYKVDDPS